MCTRSISRVAAETPQKREKRSCSGNDSYFAVCAMIPAPQAVPMQLGTELVTKLLAAPCLVSACFIFIGQELQSRLMSLHGTASLSSTDSPPSSPWRAARTHATIA